MRRMPALVLAAMIGAAAAARAQVVRVAGYPALAPLVARWAAGYEGAHPGVRVDVHMTGSDTGMAALYAGRADVALLGREPTAAEIQAFEWIFRRKPARFAILAGSTDTPGRSPALAVLVHRDNPLRALTLAQLEAILGTEHRLGPANIRTWGGLGLAGPWAERPIHLYLPDATSGTGRFLRNRVLGDSRLLAWDDLREFPMPTPTPARLRPWRTIRTAWRWQPCRPTARGSMRWPCRPAPGRRRWGSRPTPSPTGPIPLRAQWSPASTPRPSVRRPAILCVTSGARGPGRS